MHVLWNDLIIIIFTSYLVISLYKLLRVSIWYRVCYECIKNTHQSIMLRFSDRNDGCWDAECRPLYVTRNIFVDFEKGIVNVWRIGLWKKGYNHDIKKNVLKLHVICIVQLKVQGRVRTCYCFYCLVDLDIS